MRLSPFFTWIFWYSVLISLFILCYKYDINGFSILNIVPITGLMLSGCILALSTLILSGTLSEIFVYKYKIVHNIDDDNYEAKALVVWWLFIPHWVAVKTKSHSYEIQNIFGATDTNYYSSDISFGDKENALNAINEHKYDVEEKRRKFFERPKKENKKTTYL